MREINLLPPKILAQKRKGLVQKILRLSSVVLIIIFGSLSIIIFSYAKTLETKNKEIQTDIDAESQKITNMAFVENKIWLLQSRIDSLETILKQKVYYSLLIKYLKRAIPPDITLTSLSSTGEDKIAVFGTVRNYSSLAKFLKALTAPEGAGALFTQAELISAILDSKTGEAQFVVNVEWPEERLNAGGLE